MKPDFAGAVEVLQQDMREHELRHVGECHASRNQSMAVDAVTRLEREQEDRRPVPSDPAPTPAEHRRERREGEHGAYLIDRAPIDDTKVRQATPAEAWFMAHAMARVELLLSKMETGPLGQPSWNQRVLAVMELRSRVPGLRHAGRHDEAAELEKRYTFELLELLEASTATFGDWKADAPKTLSVQVA